MKDCKFADDTNLYLVGNLQNLNNARETLELFSTTSRAKINWNKSTTIWVSSEPKTFKWGNEDNLKWLQLGEMIRYLGFMVGFQVSDKDRFNAVLKALRKKLAY